MLCILKALIILIAFLFFLFIFIWKLAFNYHGEVKLNLKIFRQIYYINPEKWSYKQFYVDDVKHLTYRGRRVKLTFFAFCWFIFNKLFSKYKENKKEKRDYLIWILEDCQEDIEYLKRQADKDIEKALKTQKKILNNWR